VALETAPPLLLQTLLQSTPQQSTGYAELIISAERAQVRNLEAAAGLAIRLTAASAPDYLLWLGLNPQTDVVRAGLASAHQPLATAAASDLQQAALHLCKHARLLPALLTLPWQADFGERYDPLTVPAAAIAAYPSARAQKIVRVSEAPVPLEDSLDSRFILFRSADGAVEHLAVLVGEPDFSAPMLTRLHSACLTGDLFGSLRCDCGEQLRKAVAALAAGGGGLLLYLAQEGRNIGLANKLRAYALQDQGFDTVAADEQLGFRQDERYYDIAAAMLQDFGVSRVRLLTNNPTKISALAAHGIEVVERVALTGSSNPYNERYLDTKKRVGHLL
jgi:GTP cyclohydrolase II